MIEEIYICTAINRIMRRFNLIKKIRYLASRKTREGNWPAVAYVLSFDVGEDIHENTTPIKSDMNFVFFC